jgi:hypothetical protein
MSCRHTANAKQVAQLLVVGASFTSPVHVAKMSDSSLLLLPAGTFQMQSS